MRATRALARSIRLIARILAAHPAMQAPSISERRKRSMYNRCVFIAPANECIVVMRGGAVKPYALSHLADQVLLSNLSALVVRERTTTAALLAHLAEVEERRLYLPVAHPSMFSYCMNVLHFSEQVTFKRIRVARMARRFPAIYGALAEGRVHLSGLVRLKPFLTQDNAHELLEAVTHKSSSEIGQLLAHRFPRRDAPTRVRALPQSRKTAPQLLAGSSAAGPAEQLSRGTVGGSFATPIQGSSSEPPGPASAAQLSPGTVETPVQRPKVAPLAPRRFS